MAMESTICHFEIPADDVGAARAFYAKLFGWSIQAAPGQDYFFVRTSEEHADALGGGILPRVDPAHGITLYVTVESVDDAVSKLQELGGEVVVPKTAVPRLGWTVTARDPQGNCIGLFQRDAEAGA
jgi:predicted enzyme related to lactoylglutathione lyase